MLILSRALKKDKCTNCTTTFSTTLVVLYNKTRITAMPAEMFLHARNGFEIDPLQDNNHIRQKIIGDYQQVSNDSFCIAVKIPTYLFTPLYKGVKTYQLKRREHKTLQLIYKQYKNPQRIQTQKARLSTIQSSYSVIVLFSLLLRISQQSSHFRNSIVLRVLRVCFCFVL